MRDSLHARSSKLLFSVFVYFVHVEKVAGKENKVIISLVALRFVLTMLGNYIKFIYGLLSGNTFAISFIDTIRN